MSKTNTAYFWRKKEFVSFLLSILVFLIHISSFSQHENNGTVISDINQTVAYFFCESISRFVVPMFFILSGATFFRNYTAPSYVTKLKSRFFTLVIPYLIWNTIWMLFNIFCSYTFISRFFIGREMFEPTLNHILKGIFFYKFNLPFWFIFNLIVFTVISPIIDLLISNKGRAFISLGFIIILRAYNIHLPGKVFFDVNSIIYYFIGAIIGKHYLERFTYKSSRRTQVLSLLFLCLYFTSKTIYRPVQNSVLMLLFEIAIFTLSSFCLWNSVDMFMDHVKPHPLFSRSFAIYAMHVNVSAIITKVIALVVARKEIWAIPNFILTLIATLITIHLFCTFTERYCPRIYSLIMGYRRH